MAFFLLSRFLQLQKIIIEYKFYFNNLPKAGEAQKNISSPTSRVTFTKPTNCKTNNGHSLKKNISEKLTLEKKKVKSIINISICLANLDPCEKHCECTTPESSTSKIATISTADTCISLCIIHCKFVSSVLICHFCFLFINST